jgi:hypothetical protein
VISTSSASPSFPLKADSKFIVDPNTELALAVELQRLEPATGWRAQTLETPSCVNQQGFRSAGRINFGGNLLDFPANQS